MTNPNLEKLIFEMSHAKGEMDETKGRYDVLRKDLFNTMVESEVDNVRTEHGAGAIVRSTTSKLDEVGLLEDLNPNQIEAITITSVDHAKLEAMVELGIISPEIVAGHITIVEKTPYVRFST